MWELGVTTSGYNWLMGGLMRTTSHATVTNLPVYYDKKKDISLFGYVKHTSSNKVIRYGKLQDGGTTTFMGSSSS
jgi:hypothetical protein